MASYVNAAIKQKTREAYQNLHDTFKRQITVYKTAKVVKIATDDNYNSIYRSGLDETVSYEEVTQTFFARVVYHKMDERSLADENFFQQLKINIPHGWIRIIVEQDGWEYLKEARRVEVDGKNYSIKSDGSPKQFWEPEFYEFVLVPVDED